MKEFRLTMKSFFVEIDKLKKKKNFVRCKEKEDEFDVVENEIFFNNEILFNENGIEAAK